MHYICSDCETYISADDLRINLWNLEVSDQSFNIVDIKPTNMEDLTGIPPGFLVHRHPRPPASLCLFCIQSWFNSLRQFCEDL